MEKTVRSGLASSLTGWYESLDVDDPELQDGVNERGQAVISRYWSVWFLEGTKAEQERELGVYRADPRYEQAPTEPPNLGDVYVEYLNGGSIDRIYLKLHEERTKQGGR
ncbi:MAG TPA: hypothetical protein VLD83_17090 [Candidatus Binatia bacterium]|nr:hypothetical protein [Candidatus Binatia bacterium]